MLVYNKHLLPQHISRHLCNKHIHYRDHKSLPLANILRIKNDSSKSSKDRIE